MKIHVFCTLKEEAWGGANQFLKALRDYLISQELYEKNPLRASVIVFNSYPFREEWRFKKLLKMKRDNKVVIHRVDGPISMTRGSAKWKYIDNIIHKFNKLVADGTIFQSRWSMKKNKSIGMDSNKHETIILNGADPSIFGQKEKFQIGKKVKLVCSSWSANWTKGFELYKYLDGHLDFSRYEMTFIGNSPIKFKNISHVKPLPPESLSRKLRKYDIFIIASVNDPCSNSLIEAMSIGLPVIAINRGGHPEIVEKANSGILFNGKNDVIEKIENLVKNYMKIVKKIRPLTIDKIGKNYVEFIEKVEPRKKISNEDTFRFMRFFYFKKIMNEDIMKCLGTYYMDLKKNFFCSFRR